jgi:sigma-B regulation protein RsbU (phosphoserine phosphatase)
VRLDHDWEFLFLSIMPSESAARGSPPPSSPPLQARGWAPIANLDPADFTADLEYWVRCPLPPDLQPPAAFAVSGRSAAFACYVDGELVGAYEEHQEPAAGEGLHWWFAPLPSDAAGRTLYLWRPHHAPELELNSSMIVPTSNDTTAASWLTALQTDVHRTELRADLGYLALGTILVAIGVAALTLASWRSERRDAALLLLGMMSVIMGPRFLLGTSTIRFLLGGVPAFVLPALAYAHGAVAFGFFRHYLGRGWHSTIRWIAWGYLVFACIAVTALVLHPHSDPLGKVNNVVVILSLAAILVSILTPDARDQPGWRVLVVGGSAAVLFVTLENLRGLGLPLRFDIEWMGHFVLYLTLGYLTANRFFTNEQHLAGIRQELETARQIQMSILPRETPEIAGLRVATRYVPASAVAGDLFDFARADGSGLGILVADVAGHGVPAALIASMVKVAFQAQSEHANDPARVLSGMNTILSGEFEGSFVTAAYAWIDTTAHVLQYSGASHPPLLVQPRATQTRGELPPALGAAKTMRPAADIVPLASEGLMLGPFPEATYQTTTRPLRPGDRLLLYTDGIIEAMDSAREPWGEERLRGLMETTDGHGPEGLADAILAAVADWTGTRPGQALDDDLTVVVIDIGEST